MAAPSDSYATRINIGGGRNRPVNRPQNRPNLYNRPETRQRVASRPATPANRQARPANSVQNNVFTDRSGNVYQRDGSGNWKQRGSGQRHNPQNLDRVAGQGKEVGDLLDGLHAQGDSAKGYLVSLVGSATELGHDQPSHRLYVVSLSVYGDVFVDIIQQHGALGQEEEGWERFVQAVQGVLGGVQGAGAQDPA